MLAKLASRVGLSVRAPHGRLLGAEIDFRTACVLLELNEALVGGDESARARVPDIHARWMTARLARAIPFANDALTVQVAEMLQHIADVDAGDVVGAVAPRVDLRAVRAAALASSAYTPTPGPSSHLSPRPSLALAVKTVIASAAARADVDMRTALEARLGFSLWLGPSQAATGDEERGAAGVYLRGRAVPGAVVALYGGKVYSGEMMCRADDAGHLGNPRVQRPLIPRFDETVIDAGARTAGAERNPFALAGHVRHPPAGVSPNVMRLQFDWIDAGAASGASTAAEPDGLLPFPPALRAYVPNEWGAETGIGGALYSSLEQNIWMKGSVLIALRDLWDEELFVDHTLNPFADDAGWVPPWARVDWEARRDLRRLAGRVTWETARGSRGAFFNAAGDVRKIGDGKGDN